MSEPLVLGLDVGGTSTRAWVVRGDERVAEAEGATASVSTSGADAARETLQGVLSELGVDAVDAACLGTAGSGADDVDQFLRSVVLDVVRAPVLRVVNDAELLLPASGREEGAAVVAGTGAKAVGVLAGRHAVSGGWGFLLGDEGGGYWIVREAVRGVLRREDAGEDPGPLGATVLSAAGCSGTQELVQRFHAEPAPGGWAAHAPQVLQTADPAVEAIVRSAADHLAALALGVLRHLEAPEDTPVVLAGGVLTGSSALVDAVRSVVRRTRGEASVEVLTRPPVAGAVRLAQQAARGAAGPGPAPPA